MHTRTTLILALLTTVFMGALLYRPAVGLVYELRGAAALEAAIQIEGANQSEFACLSPAFLSPQAQLQLQEAVRHLESAADIGQNAHAYLLLGRAFCYAGSPEQAVAAYDVFVNARPRHSIGRLEMALAFSTACNPEMQRSKGTDLCKDLEIGQTLLKDWESPNPNPDQLLHLAHIAFEHKNYLESERYFVFYSSYFFGSTALSDADLFQWSISAVHSKKDLPRSAVSRLPVFPVESTIVILGDQMRWMRKIAELDDEYGRHPHVYTMQNQRAALVAWNGSIGAVIEVLKPGHYQLTLQALDLPPSPLLAQIEINDQSLGEAVFSQGDESWQNRAFETRLEPGYHIVGVRFINDELVEGRDRNLLVSWLEITYIGE